MAQKQKQLAKARHSRIMRVRKRVKGTPDHPRLAVTHTNSHLYAQIIDDESGKTLAAASSLSFVEKKLTPKEVAALVGQEIAKKGKEVGVKGVTFDRRWRKFHGLIAAIADAARKDGLQF